MIRLDKNRQLAVGQMQPLDGTKPAQKSSAIESQRKLEVAKSPRARSTSFLKTMIQRVKGAAVKGVLAASIIGATLGCATLDTAYAQGVPRQNNVVGVQLVQSQQQFIYSQAALDAATPANAKLDSISAKSWDKQVAILAATRGHTFNPWRDTPPVDKNGMVNAYVEIEKGDRNKFEFDIEKNERGLDRVIHESVGGYPINYGFVPGTFSWDGDPFDVVVLGPKIDGGQVVKGKVIGIYHMIDEKGFDPHLVISPVDAKGEALHELDDQVKQEVGDFVTRYKIPDTHKGKWAKFTGWADAQEGKKFLETTSDLFKKAVDRNPEVKAVMDQAGLHRPLKILVTGFDAFEGRAKNMTGEVLEALAQTKTSMTGVSLDTLILPVEYENAAAQLIAHIEATKPDLVISLGESIDIKGIELEARASNQLGGKTDNRGRSMNGKISPNGPKQIDSAFDLSTLERRARALRAQDGGAQIAMKLDKSGSGVFVCNEIYFRAMEAMREKPEGDRCALLFAHVPALTNASSAEVAKWVRALLDSAGEMVREATVEKLG